jgi:lipoate-protein ligase A
VIVEELPLCGEENMRRDEELLRLAIDKGEMWLRFYEWSEPTISLGHFQKENEVELPKALVELPRVKRLSGGGAIMHHHELTYSIVIPANHSVANDPTSLYDIIHERWIEVFSGLGVKLKKRGVKEVSKEAEFLCFLRGDTRDLLLGEHKIMGSAQRRRKGAILQHGSLLFKHSAFTPELQGISDLSDLKELDFKRISELFYQSELARIEGTFQLIK